MDVSTAKTVNVKKILKIKRTTYQIFKNVKDVKNVLLKKKIQSFKIQKQLIPIGMHIKN